MVRGAVAKDGRAARAKEEMPLPREKQTCQLSSFPLRHQLRSGVSVGCIKTSLESVTHLLNILPDDKERSEMGVERGW